MLRTRLIAGAVALAAVVGVVLMSRHSATTAREPLAASTTSAQPATTQVTTTHAPPSTGEPSTSTSSTSTSTVTTSPMPAPPTGLAGSANARWKPQVSLHGTPVLWTLSMHPIAAQPSVLLNAAVFDQSLLTAALFNGSKTPGGGPWKNGDRVPTAARTALTLAFNGGFLFKHITGGYKSEGRTAKKLVDGQATLGVRNDGRLVLGVLGRDLADDGSWRSLRQNLPPIVEHGTPSIDKYPGTYWGDNFHQVADDFRSAICTRSDGRLMYVSMGMVRISTLARTLPALGCETGMELDINGHWPQFVWFTGSADHRVGHLLDHRMWKPNRVLAGSEKDFFALFDPTTLPAGVLYEG